MTQFPARRPEPGPALGPGEIHVWSVDLNPSPAAVEALGHLLSADEWERARRFRFEQHRRQYVVGRGALRTLLAAYLGDRPERIAFTYGPRGKPFLETSLASSGLHFNLSNSADLALVGLVRGIEIGVDVEYLKPMPDCEEISERFFSESERQVLRSLPRELKEEAFFNCWTRKEAYLKAVGEGLAAALDSFDVTLSPGDAPRMLTLKGDPDASARWFFRHLRPAQDFIGAVAIDGGQWSVATWELEL